MFVPSHCPEIGKLKCSTWMQSQKQMQYLDAISKTTESYLFISKVNHSKVIQVYAPNSNTDEAEVEWFCEDLQDLL